MAAAIDQHTTRVHAFVTEAKPLRQQLWQAKSDKAVRRAISSW